MTRIMVEVSGGVVVRIVADNGDVVDAVVVDRDVEEVGYIPVEEDFHEVMRQFEQVGV